MEKEKNYSKLDAILDFAIKEERKDQKMYSDFAKKAINAEQKALLNKLADIEKEHAEKLLAFKEKGAAKYTQKISSTLKIDDYVEKMVDESSSLKDFLLFAINNEKKSRELYLTVRDNYVCTDDKELFESLANDELEHQRYLENVLKGYTAKY